MEGRTNRDQYRNHVNNTIQKLRNAYKKGKLTEEQTARLEAIGFQWEPRSSKSLSEAHPELAEQWHPTKNGDLTPRDVAAGSNKRVWWKCKKCGGEWEVAVVNRARGTKCPYCENKKALPGFNDLATTHPDLAKQWHPTKNGDLTPRDVVAGSGRKVWWRHWHEESQTWHEWETYIFSRASKGIPCPYCDGRRELGGFNDLATTHPDLAKQWHPAKNGDLTPRDVVAGSGRKVWWRHWHEESQTWHEWEAAVSARTRRNRPSGCPRCKTIAIAAKNSRPVIRIEDGYYYSSIKQAGEYMSSVRSSGSTVGYAIKTGGTAYGYHWRYATEEEIAAHKAGEDSDGQGEE